MLMSPSSEAGADVRADRSFCLDPAHQLELAAIHSHGVHVLHGLVIACAHGLGALRRGSLKATHGGAHLVGVGAAGFLDGLLVEEEHAVAVGAVQVGLGLVGGLKLGQELAVFG